MYARSIAYSRPYAVAFSAVLCDWTFDGFNQANCVAGEMQYPERDVPRAAHISMGLCLASFLTPCASINALPGLVLHIRGILLCRGYVNVAPEVCP